jgi:4a-hydroxytetrahydrobiopterin dehydratase
MNILGEDEIRSRLANFLGWNYISNSIQKEFKLENFMSAVKFINLLANEAERIDHHPDINLHSYNKVIITLTTHSKGGVTANDFKFADAIESLPLISKD